MEGIEYIVFGIVFVLWSTSILVSYHWGLNVGKKMNELEKEE